MDKNKYIENSLNELLVKLSPILALGGALLFLSLSALDYVSTPEHFQAFLGYRAVMSSILLLIFLILYNHQFRSILIYKIFIIIGTVGSALTVELMILQTGGHVSSYYVGIGLIGIWAISFTPVRFALSLALTLMVYGTYTVPIVFTETITDFRRFYTTNVFLIALLSSSIILRYYHLRSLVNELGLKYDLEEHKRTLENQVNDRTTRLSDSISQLQKEIAERERVELAIKESSNEWRATFDSTPDMIMTLSNDYRVLRLNKAGMLFFHQSYKDLIGKSLFQLIPADTLVQDANTLSSLKHSVKAEEGTVYLTDRKIWLSYSLDPILDENGQLTGRVFMMRDITERIATKMRYLA